MKPRSRHIDIETDICIIGGGIAGNYLASELQKRRIHCIVVEEHQKLGEPFQCAGIISQKLLKLVTFPPEIILNRVHSAEIGAPNMKKIEMAGHEHPIVIDRVAFDAYFGQLAQQAGVPYYLGERYETHWALKNGLTLIQTDRHIIRAKLIVGADGPLSKVAARGGIKVDTIPATQVRAKYDYPSEKTAMFFNPRWRELFGYIVPEGSNGICRIGLATREKPHIAIKQFLKNLRVEDRHIVDRQGGLIPYGFPRRIAFQNSVLLGDSACMVKATTGGGIVMLITAAKQLIKAIELALQANDFSANFLKRHYQSPIKRTIGIQLKVHYFIRLLLANLTRYDFNHFFKLYQTTELHALIDRFADMDFPLLLIQRLIRNTTFIRFLIHVFFRNWILIPRFLHDIVL
jgi:flavin-dependent dehydrogenase